ncbi:MAG: hypothetical protein NT080_11985 [Spirochaetes bacterium]|nr:hypothetical protein [Spirochaetota bacterium]
MKKEVTWIFRMDRIPDLPILRILSSDIRFIRGRPLILSGFFLGVLGVLARRTVACMPPFFTRPHGKAATRCMHVA